MSFLDWNSEGMGGGGVVVVRKWVMGDSRKYPHLPTDGF